jgi:hypothetical protein
LLLEFIIGEKRVTIQNSTLKTVIGAYEEKYDLSKIVMVGAKRKFSRLLLVLSIASSFLVILNAENLFYFVLAVIIFLSTILFREEGIVLVFDDRTLILSPLNQKTKKELLEYFESFLENKK